MATYYPPLSEASMTPFRAIELQLKQDPGYLDAPECPYPPMVKAMLRRLGGEFGGDTGFGGGGGEEVNGLVDAASDTLDIEIAKLYKSVQRDSVTYQGSDTKDKMSMTKMAADLLARLIDLQMKRENIRNFARGQKAMIECMEAYLTPAQRTEYIAKLKDFVDVSI